MVCSIEQDVSGQSPPYGTPFARRGGDTLQCASFFAVQNSMRIPELLQPIRVARAVLTVVLSVLALACERPGIVWTDPMTLSSSASDGRLVVDSKGRARIVPDTSLNITPSGDPRLCSGSLQATRQDDGTLVAVWWSVRDDSSADLLAAVSPDGGTTWRPPIAVDTADVSVVGCTRPPPSISASAGFVHIAYAMRGREGVGVFYAHSMDRGQRYEPPVTILYGDHLARTAIASDKSIVAVAYEDPNGATAQIGLAISRDWGHIFGDRSRGSLGVGAATSPQVAVADRQIAVAWMQGASGESTNARATRVVRVGRLE
jgi:hypothetical protein